MHDSEIQKLGEMDDLMYEIIISKLRQDPADVTVAELEMARKYLNSKGYTGIAHAPKDAQGYAEIPDLDPEIIRNLRAI